MFIYKYHEFIHVKQTTFRSTWSKNIFYSLLFSSLASEQQSVGECWGTPIVFLILMGSFLKLKAVSIIYIGNVQRAGRLRKIVIS